MNLVCLIGNITKKPELRYTTSDLAIAKFTIAIKRDAKNKDGEYESDFINCTAYGKTAELIGKYVDKGSKISTEGRIQTGSYEKDGKKIYTTDVIVEKIEFLNKLEKKEERAEKVVAKVINDNPYEAMGKQVEMETIKTNDGSTFEMPF